MLALWLLASHMVGDFLFQTRWQADGKLTDRGLRARHVATYTVAFVPAVVASGAPLGRALAFLAALFVLHYLTDSRRFRSTLGDVIRWQGVHLRRYGLYVPTRPNPWEPLPILIDQTLHIAQLAVLGSVFLA